MRIFLDKFRNKATITKRKIYPYYQAPHKEDAYILKIISLYEKNMCTFLSVYETEQDALDKLKTFNCGSYKEIKYF